MRRTGRLWRSAGLLLLLAGLHGARAGELGSDEGGESLSLNPTAKLGTLLSQYPDDPILYPQTDTALALARLRLDLSYDAGTDWNAMLSYDHFLRWSDVADGSGAGSGILAESGRAPYRLSPLGGATTTGEQVTAFHEIDRLLLSWHPDWGEVIIGRQAIGLGRGVLFSAVDFFAPFSPLQVDQEWRRGVDAARLEYKLGETSSLESIAVVGERESDSAYLLRLRGYLGDWDAEILAGRRGLDTVLGAVISGAVADAEVHAEAVLLDLPDCHRDGSIFGRDDLVPQLVVGASYVIDWGAGLSVLGEYHYNGLGFRDTGDSDQLAFDADLQERLRRGDMRVLGRHALGLQLGYPINVACSAGFAGILNPTDGSGLLSPSLRWDLNQHASVIVAGYIPFGEEPELGDIRSEYGVNPYSLFLQLALYY